MAKKKQEAYVLHEVAKLVRGLDIKMVGAWGFEPQTPTVSRPSLGHLGPRAIFAHPLNINQMRLEKSLNTVRIE